MRHRVEPGSKVRLKDYHTDDTGEYESREKAEGKLERDVERMAKMQERMYAENQQGLIVVLQAMDTGGKDGCIKHVMSGVNPTGCEVTSFKRPSEEERDHDFLWRVHKAVPNYGNIGIFNRSHYEDVLVVRVHNLVPKDVWKQRYDQINRFEQHLAENNYRILKFFLHISKDEQKRRLEARLREPEKLWKFESGDLEERKLWDDYMDAYEDVLSKTSTSHAPWFVIPADKKWYRNLAVAKIIADTLEEMEPGLPKATIDPSKIVVV
jgi:PPK2 family polyphosphate:nucleotide phosphotransferase